jgi:hypothetical protein
MYHLPNDYADIVGTGHCPVFEYGFSSLIFEFSLLGSSYSAIVQIDKLFHNANLIKFVTSGPKAGNFSFTLPPQPKVPRIPISVRWNIRDGQFNMPFTSGQLTIPVSGTQKQPPPPPPCTPQTTDPHIVILTKLTQNIKWGITSYTLKLTATGGEPPYTYCKAGGHLPYGIKLSSTGVFSGRVYTVETVQLVVRVTDARHRDKTFTMTFIVLGPSKAVTNRPGNPDLQMFLGGWVST